MTRRACRVDSNHAPIRDGLRAAGYEVLDMSAIGGGVPDLCIRIHPGRSLFIEVKRPDIKKAQQALTKEQETWWYFNNEITRVVQSLEEAIKECKWAEEKWRG